MSIDTSKYIKKCPNCGADVEPKRCASTGDKIFAGFTGACGGIVGFALGGPAGAVAGAGVGYYANKKAIMSISDDHDHSQKFKFKCPNCGCKWKANIHTNDNPEDPSWLGNVPY